MSQIQDLLFQWIPVNIKYNKIAQVCKHPGMLFLMEHRDLIHPCVMLDFIDREITVRPCSRISVYHQPETLQKIIERSAGILRVPITEDAAAEIARRSRGTPRIANALLRRVRDFAQVKGSGKIDTSITKIALTALNIDQYGLDEIDNRILLTIIDKFRGGPVGITTIATAIGEDSGTLEEVYEPFLIMEGFIKRTPRGRMVTELAYRHFGRNPYTGNIMEPGLFE